MWSSFRKRLSSRSHPLTADLSPGGDSLLDTAIETSNATCNTSELEDSESAFCGRGYSTSDGGAIASNYEEPCDPPAAQLDPPSPSVDQEDSLIDDRGRNFSLSDVFRARFLRKNVPVISLTPDVQVATTEGHLARILIQIEHPAPADIDGFASLDVVCVVDISRVRSLLEVEDMVGCLLEKLDSSDRLALVTSRPALDHSPVLHQLKRMTSHNKRTSASMAITLPPNRSNDLLVALAHAHMLFKARAWSNSSCALVLITDQLRRPESELDLVRSLLQPIVRLRAGVGILGVGPVRDIVRWHRMARSLDIACCAPSASALSKVMDWLLRSQRLPSFHDLEVNVSSAAPSARLVAIQAIGGSILLQDNTGDAIVKFRDLYCGEIQDLLITVSLADIDQAVVDCPVLSVKASATLTSTGTKVVSRRVVCKVSRLLPKDFATIPKATPAKSLLCVELLLQTIAALDQAALFVAALDFERGKELLAGAYMRLAVETSARMQDATLQHLLYELEVAMEQAVASQAQHDGSVAPGESHT